MINETKKQHTEELNTSLAGHRCFIINRYRFLSRENFYFMFNPNFFATLQPRYFVVISQMLTSDCSYLLRICILNVWKIIKIKIIKLYYVIHVPLFILLIIEGPYNN